MRYTAREIAEEQDEARRAAMLLANLVCDIRGEVVRIGGTDEAAPFEDIIEQDEAAAENIDYAGSEALGVVKLLLKGLGVRSMDEQQERLLRAQSVAETNRREAEAYKIIGADPELAAWSSPEVQESIAYQRENSGDALAAGPTQFDYRVRFEYPHEVTVRAYSVTQAARKALAILSDQVAVHDPQISSIAIRPLTPADEQVVGVVRDGHVVDHYTARAARAEELPIDPDDPACHNCGKKDGIEIDEDGIRYCRNCDLVLDHLTEDCDECGPDNARQDGR